MDEFKPYVPPDANPREITAVSVVTGILLSVVFGAANAYLALRVGMTVSASIPAAVISMGIVRKLLRRDSILENNMVQTIGSAGESLTSGIVFTVPALFLWASEGVSKRPAMLTIILIALCGGVLGVMFMVPLRKSLIVREHGKIPYPEGTACAEVLLAGEKSGGGAKTVFLGLAVAAVVKFLEDGLKIAKSVVEVGVRPLNTMFAVNVGPALVGVGYICGARVATGIFSGALFSWFVMIPLLVEFGGDGVMFPAVRTVAELYASGGAGAIWSNYIRYIGAGCLAMAGFMNLAKSFPSIVRAFAGMMGEIKGAGETCGKRTDRDLGLPFIAVSVLLAIIVMCFAPQIPFGFFGALLVAVLGFFFGTVSSKMVGLIGSSNNPISGMTIATLLVTAMLFRAMGIAGVGGMVGSLAIGACICAIVAIAGDTSQDLKTGYLLGATPRKQQAGELIGVGAASLSMGGVMVLLDRAWGFGSAELAAPQATLMKMVVEGVMAGNLPWKLVASGAFAAVAAAMLGANPLSVAMGVYLPLETTSAIMLGGLLKAFEGKMQSCGKFGKTGGGVLFCSGMIAGEGLVGILLAGFAVANLDLSLRHVADTGALGGVLLSAVMLALVLAAEDGRKGFRRGAAK